STFASPRVFGTSDPAGDHDPARLRRYEESDPLLQRRIPVHIRAVRLGDVSLRVRPDRIARSFVSGGFRLRIRSLSIRRAVTHPSAVVDGDAVRVAWISPILRDPPGQVAGPGDSRLHSAEPVLWVLLAFLYPRLADLRSLGDRTAEVVDRRARPRRFG